MDLQVSGVSKFKINKAGSIFPSQATINGLSIGLETRTISSTDLNEVILRTVGGPSAAFAYNGGCWVRSPFRIRNSSDSESRLETDSSNILAQRNGINPQAFRLYNTYTSSTNFERLNLRWDTNVVKIGTEKGSAGGTARDLVFETDALARITITSSGDIGIGNTSPTSKLQVTNGDIEVETIASGLILKSPDGTRYRVTVANGGTLSVAAV
jgi:hypothetical protein